MKTLWAPWRITYLLDDDQKPSKKKLKNNCIFCEAGRVNPSADNLVLHRGRSAYVIMNRYPYSNGHLMVIPYRHVSDYTKIKTEEHAEMGELLALCVKLLKKYGHCDGFNVGMNLGEVAGAGIKDHLHYHVVPRWKNDHNFMPVLADMRVVPEHMLVTYEKLKALFDKA